MALLHRASADIVADDDTRTVVVQLAEYGDVRTVSDDGGRTKYREAFESLKPAERFHVRDEHGGDIIGHADPATFRETPNPTIDLTIADTAKGRDTLALVRAGSLDSVSVEFLNSSGTATKRDGVTWRSAVEILGCAFAFRPAHNAPIAALRHDEMETTTMEETTITDAAPALVREDLDNAVNELRREITTVRQMPASDPYAELSQFANFGELTRAAYKSQELQETLSRALTDQISDNNPGAMLPNSISNIAGVITQTRPTIASFGTDPLPASGLSFDYPFYDGDVTTLVGQQVTEKSGIVSARVDIKRGSQDILTYAGGSDISQQLIERSADPAYLAAYMRIMAIGMAATTELEMGAAVTAAATDGSAIWNPVGGTAPDLRTALFTASIAVEAATGSPAQFALAASDVFTAIGSLDALYPATYGVQNVPGTADAASLNVNVSGLPVRHCQHLAPGTLLVSNSTAASWAESPTKTLSAPDVELLGTNVAVYQYGVAVPYLPAGIIKVPAA